MGAALLAAGCAPGAETAERVTPPVAVAIDAFPTETAPPTTRSLPTHADGSVRGTVPPVAAVSPGPTVPAEPFVGQLLVFGDSVARLLVDDLALALPDALVVDAVDCRRIDRGFVGPCGGVPSGVARASGLEDLQHIAGELREAGASPDGAVVVLANNSSLLPDQLDAAMVALADVPTVWWVNTRIVGFGRQDPNNRALADLAARDPRAEVVDWFAASAGQDWLSDHVHPNDAGQVAMAALVADAIACTVDGPATSDRGCSS